MYVLERELIKEETLYRKKERKVMNIKKVIEEKLRKAHWSPESEEEVVNLVLDAIEADDLCLLMGPVVIFHEGYWFDPSHLSDEEYEEFMGFVPNVIVDERGYVNNLEYLTGAQLYHIMKRYGLLSLTARILEAKEVSFDRLWDLVNEQVAPFELKEAIVLRGLHAINERDIEALKGEVSYTVEGQEFTVRVPEDDAQKLLDSWGVTALVKELIGD